MTLFSRITRHPVKRRPLTIRGVLGSLFPAPKRSNARFRPDA
jgi:hypothetical protein